MCAQRRNALSSFKLVWWRGSLARSATQRRLACMTCVLRLQFDTMRVLLYRQLRQKREHIESMALHWNRWQQANLHLDVTFMSTMHALQRLPLDLDMPVAFLDAVMAIAAMPDSALTPADAPHGATAARPTPAQSARELPVDPARRDPPAEAHGSGGTGPAAASQAGAHEGSSAGGSHASSRLCHANLTLQEHASIRRTAARLLGASAPVTKAASAALRRLSTVHAAAAELRNHTATVQLEPGLVFDASQLVHIFSTYVRFGTAPADIMAVCQLAATQQKREEIGSLPFFAVCEPPFGTPLP